MQWDTQKNLSEVFVYLLRFILIFLAFVGTSQFAEDKRNAPSGFLNDLVPTANKSEATSGEKVGKSIFGISLMGNIYRRVADNASDGFNYTKAIEYYNKALKAYSSDLGENHSSTGIILNDLGLAYHRKGDYNEALKYYEKSLLYDKQGNDSSITQNNIAVTYLDLGESQKAINSLERALNEAGGNEIDSSTKASSFQHLGSAYKNLAKYDEAVKYYKKSLDLRKQVLKVNKSDLALSYRMLGSTYVEIGLYEKAESVLEKAVKITLVNFGERHLETAYAYSELGFYWRKKGEYDKALEYSEKSLAIKKKIFGKDNINVAVNLNQIGILLHSRGSVGDLEKSVNYLQESLRIRKLKSGSNHPETATSYENLGVVYNNMGRTKEALSNYEKALSIKKRIFEESHPSVALSFYNLGRIHSDLANFEKSLELHKRALAILLKNFGNFHERVATAYEGLGLAYSNMGFTEKALKCHSNSLEINLKIFGKDHPSVAISYNNLAYCYSDRGEDYKSINLKVMALEIRKKTMGEFHEMVADSHNNLGNSYASTGQVVLGIKHLNQALRIYRVNYGENHRSTAQCLFNLGIAYEQVNLDSTLYFLQATHAFRHSVGINHPSYAKALSALGWRIDSLKLMEDSIKILSQNFGDEHILISNPLNNLSVLLCERGDIKNGLRTVLESHNIIQKHFHIGHPRLSLSFDNVSWTYMQLENMPEALFFARKGIESKEFFLNRIFKYLPQKERLRLHASIRPYDIVASIGEAKGLSDLILKHKGFVLDSMLEDSILHSMTSNSELKILFEQKRKMQAELGLRPSSIHGLKKKTLTDAIEKESIKALENKNISRRAMKLNHKDLIESLEENQVLVDYLEYWQKDFEKPATSSKGSIGVRLEMVNSTCRIKEIFPWGSAKSSKLISKGDTILKVSNGNNDFVDITDLNLTNIISLVRGPAHSKVGVTVETSTKPKKISTVYLERKPYRIKTNPGKLKLGALIQSRDQDSPNWINLGPVDEIYTKIRELKVMVKQGLVPPKNIYKELYDQLFLPIRSTIPSFTKSIIFCPDAELNFIPFPALIDKNGSFLCEKYDIMNVSASRDLLFGNEPASKSKEISIFANPAFDDQDIEESLTIALMDTDRNAMRNLGFSPLPGTKKEAEELSLISDSNGYSVNSFSKLNASEKNLRAIKSPTILHLATHGFFISSEEEKKSKNQWSFLNENKLEAPISNPMHRSGLALAGAKNTLKLWEEGKFVDPANDGILTAEEASQLDLSETWLTVLSACDTGSGVARAGEGVLGLRRAFAMAGTENLLLTLWPVDDSFTKDFMVSFYKEALKTGNAPKAMAKVQKEWLIKLREERSVSQAVKLAGPFVLTFRGNPELN